MIRLEKRVKHDMRDVGYLLKDKLKNGHFQTNRDQGSNPYNIQ